MDLGQKSDIFLTNLEMKMMAVVIISVMGCRKNCTDLDTFPVPITEAQRSQRLNHEWGSGLFPTETQSDVLSILDS